MIARVRPRCITAYLDAGEAGEPLLGQVAVVQVERRGFSPTPKVRGPGFLARPLARRRVIRTDEPELLLQLPFELTVIGAPVSDSPEAGLGTR
jgi:hypothetical protein